MPWACLPDRVSSSSWERLNAQAWIMYLFQTFCRPRSRSVRIPLGLEHVCKARLQKFPSGPLELTPLGPADPTAVCVDGPPIPKAVTASPPARRPIRLGKIGTNLKFFEPYEHRIALVALVRNQLLENLSFLLTTLRSPKWF